MLRVVRPAALALGLLLATAAPALGASGTAPGAPGDAPNWAPANKDGFGTATTHEEQGLAHALRTAS